MQVSGVIQDVSSRDVNTARGPGKSYSVTVAGQRYSMGFSPVKANVGDYVTFEATQNGQYWNGVARTLTVGKNPDAGSAASQQSRAAPQSVGSFDKRQDAISRQAASNTAIAFMQLLSAHDALPIASSKSKGDKQAAMEALLQGYEQRFYEANTGQKWVDISPTPRAAEGATEESVDDIADSDPWQ